MQQQQTGIRIKKFLIHETGTYNQQYRRPYNTNLDGRTLGILQEKLHNADKIAPSMLAGVANQFIAPSPTPEKPIDLIGGWGERRMRFMMELEHNYCTGGQTVLVILGYTNYNGISHGGHVDPNMEFYVNSTLHIRNTQVNTPMGNQLHTAVIDSSLLLVDNNWNGIHSQGDQRMRPMDVYSTMSRTHLPTGSNVLDMRATNSNTAAKSRRSNNLAGNFAANILQNYQAAADAAEFGVGEQEILASARGFASEHLVGKDPFLSAMSDFRGMPIGNTFTFDNLRRLDPNVDNVTIAQIMLPAERTTVHTAGQTAEWGGSDRETVVATILSQSVPALLMDLALTRIVFKASNRDISNQITIGIYDVGGFSSGDQSFAMQMFQQRLEHEVLRNISFDNETDFAIEMQVDLLGETWIRMMLDNKAQVDFVAPSFCDALSVPVLTMNQDLSMDLATDFTALSTALRDDCQFTSSAINVPGGTRLYGNI